MSAFENTVQGYKKKWQARLGLSDWELDVRIARHHQLHGEHVGECDPFHPKKQATISILDPIDYDPNWNCTPDPEYTMVHELLHIHFDAACEWSSLTDSQRLATEQAIHKIAKGLIETDRR